MSELVPIDDVLKSLHGVFEHEGVRWFLFGAQAAVIWGRPRYTSDVDITIQDPTEHFPSLIDALREGGFELRIHEDVDAFIAQARVFPVIHVASETHLDLILAGPGLEERFFERSVSVPFGDIEIPVISPEDLIVTKVLAGRPIDIEDVRGILIERGESLDVDLIRSTLHVLEEALGQNDLIPLFEAERRGVLGR